MTNRLAQFGHSFQIKSIVCFMTKPNFIEQVFDILDEKHYDGDAMQWIVKHCKDYFTEYNKQLDILDNIEDINNPEKFIPVGKTFTILKKEFGCV